MPRSRSAPTSRRRHVSLIAVLVALLLLVPSQSRAQLHIEDVRDHEVEDFDSRRGTLAPTAGQLAAAAALGAEVRWSRFGTPQSVFAFDGSLAAALQAEDAAGAARSWVDANAALFRSSPTDSLEVQADLPLRGSDARVVVFRQRVDGLLVSPDGLLSVGVVGSRRGGWDVVYASSSMVSHDAIEGSRELTSVEALVEAAADVEADVGAADVEFVGMTAGWRAHEIEGLDDEPQLVRPVAFPTPRRGVIRAFETVLTPAFDEGYRHIVSAETGEILFRESLVHSAASPDDPEWKIFPSFPAQTGINRYPWNYPSADIREVWCWDGLPGCKRRIGESSPHPDVPWDVHPVTGIPTFTTTGNYAHSQENWFDFLFPGPTGYQPTSLTREYTFPFENVWFEEECDPEVLVVGSGNDIDAATTNLFAGHNRMHNWAYHLGFTEETWNAQLHNFGMGTAEGDPLIGMVQAGAVSHGPPSYAGRDNAFMRTLPDGTSPQSAMFLWQPIPGAFYAPCVDGDYDMAVIAHEYGHLIENRMIGKGSNRTGFHAGAMGESVADLMAMEILNAYNLVGGGLSAYAIGTYVTGNTVEAIRNYNMSFQSAGRFPQEGSTPRVNPLNFSAVGYDIVGPQVHATGEIWSAMNFDMRELFLSRYPAGGRLRQECADGQRPVTACGGNQRWIQLMFDSFLLMPSAPTMLDARDAILAADMMRFGGANQDILWLAFARRGFGEGASNTGTQDVLPVASWESPLHGEATLNFSAVAKDEGNTPVADFQVYVGHYEARVRPIDPVTRFVPRAPEGYDFVAHAPGYGHVRFNVRNLSPGETRNIVIRFPTNWASQSKGATATGDGENHANLIDDTEGTNWGTHELPNVVIVDPPSSAAGEYSASGATFGPPPTEAGISGDIVVVNDGSANPTEGCDPLIGFPAGAIALIDRGTCTFPQKVNNAQDAGAVAVIVANNVPGAPFTMTGTDPDIVIPSVMVSLADGSTIKAGLPATGTVARRPTVLAQGQQVVIEMDGARRFELAKASALLQPGQNRFIALRQFELYACVAGGAQNPTCDGETDAGWRRILRSRADAFPAVNPRPVGPELNLRAFNVPRTRATHVKFVVLNNQCTGQTSFQGKQDRDPRHETDCRIGTPLPRRDTHVRASEIQLLSSKPEVTGAHLAE